ncbi:MAG: MFS transporter [Candidatus Thorarchaeota archaeon]|jgi:DHA1 family multidrug resistance protein-like MFS transporter
MDEIEEQSAVDNALYQESVPDKKTGMYQVWMLAISLSILQIGFGIVTPIFPFYIVELGVGATELGVLAASFALTRILLAGPLGGLSDRVGRKRVLLVALAGFAVSNLIYAYADSIIVMIIARSLEGGISAGFYPAANAFVSDMTTPENRGSAMGYLSMGNMVGFVVGPSLGGILAEYLGIRLPFVIAAAASLVTLVILNLIVHEPERQTSLSELEKRRIPVREVFSKNAKAYSALGITMFANMFAIGILEVAFMLDAVQRYAFSPLQIGVFFGVLGVIVIIGNIAFGKMSDRLGRKWLITSGSLVAALSLYFFMIASGVVEFYLAGAILGVAISMRGPTIQAMIADLSDARAYGSVMGTFGAISNSAYVVGPILGGVMFDTSGDSISALGLTVMVSVASAFVAGIGLPDYKPSTASPDSE